MKVLEVIDVRHDPAAVGIVLQIVDHPVHHVEHAFLILVFYLHLIAVGLSDAAVRIRPLVPDMAVQVMDVVGLPLPDPQKLVGGRLDGSPPEGQGGKFLPQVIAVHNAEALYGIGRRSVRPVGPYLFSSGVRALIDDIPAHLLEYVICVCHVSTPFRCPAAKNSVLPYSIAEQSSYVMDCFLSVKRGTAPAFRSCPGCSYFVQRLRSERSWSTFSSFVAQEVQKRTALCFSSTRHQ